MNTTVRNVLIEIARKKGIIHYQELCDKCNLPLHMYENPHDRAEIGRILGEISTFEYEQERPLLSALVISKSGDEGDGFYRLCEYLEICGDWKKLKRDGVFAIQEMTRCHEFWSNEDNYQKFR